MPLALLADTQVEGGLARLNTELLGPGHRADDLRRLEELLWRDAAPMQAGASDAGFLDEANGESCCRPIEGGGLATGTTTEDNDVEFVGHGRSLTVEFSRT